VITADDEMESNHAHLLRRLDRMTGYSRDGLTGLVWSLQDQKKNLCPKVQIFHYSATGEREDMKNEFLEVVCKEADGVALMIALEA
jgi:hypothetical protein